MSSDLDSLVSPLSPQRVLHEDADLIVIDKPAGMSMVSPERGDDDLVSRVKLLIANRDGTPPGQVYLAVHEHLDRDVSGVVALSRRPQANAAIAAQVQAGSSRLAWLAVVEGRPATKSGEASVKLVRERTGVIRPATRRDRNGQRVVLRWRVTQEQGNRSLVEVRVDHGGARHVRAAFSSVTGLRIAGDSASRAPGAPRLMLHAAALEMQHPSSRSKLRVQAPAPAALQAWLRAGSTDVQAAPAGVMLDELLREAASRRWPIAARGDVDAYRLFHGEGEGLPGCDIDRVGDHLIVWVGEQFAPDYREELLDAAWRLGPKGVYLKIRPKQASRIVDPRRPEVAPARAVRGVDAPEELVVREGDLKFWVRPGDGLSTGLFLDQRDNRTWLAGQSGGRSVLNLFSYTCSFTIAAARAGARTTVSVDSASRVLGIGERNLELNGLAGDQHVMVCDDVLSWLPRARRSGQRFDRIVLDPPSYSTTHKSRFSFTSDIVGVAEECFGLVSDGGGIVLACTNQRTVHVGQLRRSLHRAAEQAHRTVGRMVELPAQIDFPVQQGAEPHMKAIAVEVERR
ncbi:MAG: class I SAM-dependent methyltransferase [Deltaproteobacteria bacterium]|nr:class I SAM-dependent methyltransferase [Deltaproteobacteria bacterium]